MTIEVEVAVEIARPRAEVAEIMFDPAHDAIWTTGVIDVRPGAPGPLRKGSRVERTVKFVGRRFAYAYDVLDADGRSFVEMEVAQPFPMKVRYELEDTARGTIARIRTHGDPGAFFSLAGPLLSRMVRRNIANDLELLKEYVEGRAEGR